MTKKNIEFIKDIRELDIGTYETTINRYVDYVSHNRAVLSVYQIGSTNDPGISDIDLVVVVDPVIDPEALDSLRVLRFDDSEVVRYLFLHDVYLYDRESFKYFNYNVHGELRFLWGVQLDVEGVENDEVAVLGIQNIFDFVSSRLVQFYQFLASGKLSVRGALVRISSIKHSYDLLKRAGFLDPGIEAFVQTISEMRKSAHAVDLNDLFSLYMDSFDQFSRVVCLAAECFREQYLPCHEAVDLGNSLKLNSQFLMRFVDKSKGLNPASRIDPTILYPDVSYYHYREMARWDGIVSRWARHLLSGNCNEYYELDHTYSRILRRRVDSMSRHYEFLASNRISYGMKGYPGFAVQI